MWSLRGALRHDLRYEGFEFEEGNIETQNFHEYDTEYGSQVGEVDDSRCNERRLPLCRSPVCPPASLINTRFAFELSEIPARGDQATHLNANSDGMADTTETFDEDITDGIESAAVDAAAAALDGEAIDADQSSSIPDCPLSNSDLDESTSEIPKESDESDSESESYSDSDSESEMVYGSLWKTSMITFSKETVEKYEKQKLSRKFYVTVMRDFRLLHLAGPSAEKISAAVNQLTDKALALRFPENWYLLPQKPQDIRVLRGVDVSAYTCCETVMVPLGSCAARSPDLHFRETPCALLLDLSGRFFLYDAETDGVYRAAENIDQLARRGLSLCEPAYRDGGAGVPLPSPRGAVRKLISAATIGLEDTGVVVKSLSGTAIELTDPATGASTTFQLFGGEELKRKMPFAVVDAETYSLMVEYVSFRLAESWIVIGGLGEFDANATFWVSTVVILGTRGTVYGFCRYDNDVFRLADELPIFFKKGGVVHTNRFDRGANGEVRLERTPTCPHIETPSESMTRSAGVNHSRRDLDGWYRWILRTKCLSSATVAPTNVAEAKRQFSHPAKGVAVVIETSESYKPRAAPPDAFNSLTAGERSFRFPRTVNTGSTSTGNGLAFYRKWVRALGLFDDGAEKTEYEIMKLRADRLSVLQKNGSSLYLPPVSRAIVQPVRYDELMSEL